MACNPLPSGATAKDPSPVPRHRSHRMFGSDVFDVAPERVIEQEQEYESAHQRTGPAISAQFL
jgi:hypothetical protein